MIAEKVRKMENSLGNPTCSRIYTSISSAFYAFVVVGMKLVKAKYGPSLMSIYLHFGQLLSGLFAAYLFDIKVEYKGGNAEI